MRVAIIDSGIDECRLGMTVQARRDFAVAAAPGDTLGHGTAVARLLLAAAPGAELLDARIFGEAARCPAMRVAAAIEWAIAAGAQLATLSFGQRQPNAALRTACARAADAGLLLVASAPARGAPVFPAAYADCIAVAGDARCVDGELSWLGLPGIDFGACPRRDDERPEGGGASFAAARFAGRAACCLANGVPAAAVVPVLRAGCRHLGPERRGTMPDGDRLTAA